GGSGPRGRSRRERSGRPGAARERRRRDGFACRGAAGWRRRGARQGGLTMATSTQEWIEELKSISVLELAERIKALEEEFGGSAQAVAAPVGAPAGGGAEAGGEVAEESGTLDVVLTEAGDKKIQ